MKPTLQFIDHPRIFAMGDIIEWKEEKQAVKAMGHVPIVTNNVLFLLGQKSSLKNYKGTFEAIALTNGKVNTLFSVWRGSLTYFVRTEDRHMSVC